MQLPTVGRIPVWILLCLAVAATRLFFPGDTAFIHDEAELIGRALEQNQSGQWVTHGLRGSRGVEYGPLPTLFYRGLLAVTHSPLAWVLLKTLILSSLMAWAVVGFLRLFPTVPRWCACVPFLSLYLWFYARDLWDNSLNVGITAVLFYSYLRFLEKSRRRWLALAGVCAVCAILVHLMAVPLVAAVALHFVATQWRWVRSHPIFTAVLTLVCGAALWPYFSHLLAAPKEASGWTFRPASFFFALYGARDFSAAALEYFFGWGWFLLGPLPLQALCAAAVGATLYAFIPTFYGVWICVRKLNGPHDLARDAAWVAILALLFHIGLMSVNALVSHPHYYNAIWFVFFVFFCFGQAALPRTRSWWVAGRVYLLGLALSYAAGVAMIHFSSGNREMRYGTTLGNQLELVEQMNCYPFGTRLEDARTHSMLVSLATLRPFVPCQSGSRKAEGLRLRYAAPEAIRDGRVVLEPLH
jgi:hypothetical protein